MARNGGYNALADVITQTVDGADLARMWSELQASLTLQNDHRSSIAALFTSRTVSPAEVTAQSATGTSLFEDASEFGEPVGLRLAANGVHLGTPLTWRDLATRFTWRFLADATADQINAIHNSALEADNRQVFRAILASLTQPTTIATRPVNELGTSIFSLYAGETDDLPPVYAGTTFSAQHTHYFTTQSVPLDGVDLRDLCRKVTEHGFGAASGAQLIVLCNPAEADVVSGFRAGQGTIPSPFDFIPSQDAPAYLTSEVLVGDRAPGTFNGLTVIGSFGRAWVVADDFIPAGYVIAVATGGPNSPLNPLSFREHRNPQLRGLRLLAGNPTNYPLTDSYYQRGFGIGVRQRGAAAVMQVTTSSTYTAPTLAAA